MTRGTDLLRLYLNSRLEMGDPEIYLPNARREATLEQIRRLGAGAPSARRGPGHGPAIEEVGDAEVGRLAVGGAAEEIRALPTFAALSGVALRCTRCGLHRGRTQVVFADGAEDARVLCIGEAPGAREDETGVPFVGRAGKLLDRLLISVGLPRAEVYICNVLKCRPPGNRNPLPEEIEACRPFLERQIEFVRPRVIVAFGTFAAQTLLGTRESLRRMRGRTHLYAGYPLVVTYHPAALLRNPGWTRATWVDLQKVRRLADGDALDELLPGGGSAPGSRVERDTGGPATGGGGRRPEPEMNLELNLGGQDG